MVAEKKLRKKTKINSPPLDPGRITGEADDPTPGPQEKKEEPKRERPKIPEGPASASE